MSTGARSHPGYLARPDLRGEWPTVLVAGPTGEASSSVNAICRHLARNAMAAVAPAAGGVDAFVGFITNPAGDWSNAEYGFGVLGLGDGCGDAVRLAASSELVASLALIAPTIDDELVAALRAVDVPILGCGGRDSLDGLDSARSAAPHAEWVVYDGVDPEYWDVSAEGYSPAAADDTEERVTGFFADALPPRI